MKTYKEPNWEALYDDEFQGAQRERHQPIADQKTGMVFPNQHDLELFVKGDSELTALGKHLTETGEGGLAMTPDGMRFTLRNRKKTRGYWAERARVFARTQNGAEREEPSALQQHAEATEVSAAECPKCAGSGLADDERICDACGGYGVPVTRPLDVAVRR